MMTQLEISIPKPQPLLGEEAQDKAIAINLRNSGCAADKKKGSGGPCPLPLLMELDICNYQPGNADNMGDRALTNAILKLRSHQ